MLRSMTSSTSQTTFITTYIEDDESEDFNSSDLRPGLIFQTGYEAGRVYMLDGRQTLVGRGDDSQIQILEPDVSRRHALLDVTAEGVEIIDMRSRNGIFVNGERVHRHWLEDQDQIRIGGVATFKLAFMSAAEQKFLEGLFTAAVHDSLTRLYNKRYFLGMLEKRLVRGMLSKASLALLALDLDYFKRLNDTHGHPVGDKALRHVADLIRAECRDLDVVSRFGGEEFLVMLHDVSMDMAVQIAERIRSSIERTPVQHRQTEIPMTVSIGVAMNTECLAKPEQLITLADNRLYHAKEAGRNRVCNNMPDPSTATSMLSDTSSLLDDNDTP